MSLRAIRIILTAEPQPPALAWIPLLPHQNCICPLCKYTFGCRIRCMPQKTPTSISRADAQALLIRMKEMTNLFQKLTNGSITIQDGEPLIPPAKIKRVLLPSDYTDDRLAATLRDVKEPKRQRKERNLQPRTAYSLNRIKTPTQLKAVQNLAPAGSAIVIYLATHPKATVPELMAQLDLKRKTVANHLSLLKQKDLIVVTSV
jgi:hypothetical protein